MNGACVENNGQNDGAEDESQIRVHGMQVFDESWNGMR